MGTAAGSTESAGAGLSDGTESTEGVDMPRQAGLPLEPVTDRTTSVDAAAEFVASTETAPTDLPETQPAEPVVEPQPAAPSADPVAAIEPAPQEEVEVAAPAAEATTQTPVATAPATVAETAEAPAPGEAADEQPKFRATAPASDYMKLFEQASQQSSADKDKVD